MVQELLRRSIKATCGVMEREVTVLASKVSGAITKLKAAGYRVIGTSYGKEKAKKIWFILRGGF